MSATPVEPTCRHTTVPVSAHAAMIGSHQSREDRFHADAVRHLGQRDRGETACRVAPDLVRGLVGIGEEGDAHRDDAVGVLRVPLVVEPVVPRARHREAELGIAATGEHRSAEAGDLRREIHRRPHAVDVHVANAGVDVVTAGAHLVEARRLDLPVLALAADDRVQSDLEEDLAVEVPHLVALFGLDDLGCEVLQLRREPARRTCRAARRGGRRWRRACNGSGAVPDRLPARASRSCAS